MEREIRHGGDWKSFLDEYGNEPLDFSANVSPLGLPQGAKEAAIQALQTADRYPDPECRELRKALAEYLSLPGEQILCGNGAADLINRLVAALQPKHALLPVPTFEEYAACLQRHGCKIRELLLDEAENFAFNKKILGQITPETDLLILCQPNNPTGRTANPFLLKQILERCRECGCFLLADECFLDFLPDAEEKTLLPELLRGNLIVLRAFTKFYGMAGLRLGYCVCADTELLEKAKTLGQPWPVSSVAQAAGTAALEEKEYAQKLKALISEQRVFLQENLAELGMRVIPGEANFLLFFCGDLSLTEKLKEKGILIRSCEKIPGLGPGWARIAVRTENENRRLLEAIKSVVKQ